MKKWGNGPQKKQDVDTCVMCGRVVQEGTQVCTVCNRAIFRKGIETWGLFKLDDEESKSKK